MVNIPLNSPADHAEPREPVIEGVSACHCVYIWMFRGWRGQLSLVLVHLTHQL